MIDVDPEPYLIHFDDVRFGPDIVDIWRSYEHHNSIFTIITALLLYFHQWCGLRLDLVPAIIAKSDDGGADSDLLRSVYQVTGERPTRRKLKKQHQASVAHVVAALSASFGLPRALREHPPDHFLLCDSGANINVLWDNVLIAYLLEHNSKLQWGGERATSACIGIGHLVCVVHTVDLKDNSSSQIILNSGATNAWIVPDSSKQIFSLAIVARQGHKPVISGPNPGLFLANTDVFIPFVYTEKDKFLYLPCYPPPSRSNLLVNNYPAKLKVHDLSQYSRERNIEYPWALPADTKKLRKATRMMRRKVKDGYK